MPWEDTLKCTTVVLGGGARPAIVSDMALATACGPVKLSMSVELMYSTLQAVTGQWSVYWSVCIFTEQRTNRFHNTCLRKTLQVYWPETISNTCLRKTLQVYWPETISNTCLRKTLQVYWPETISNTCLRKTLQVYWPETISNTCLRKTLQVYWPETISNICLRKTLQVYWPETISNTCLRKTPDSTKQQNIYIILERRRWKRLKHIFRITDDLPAKTSLTWSPEELARSCVNHMCHHWA